MKKSNFLIDKSDDFFKDNRGYLKVVYDKSLKVFKNFNIKYCFSVFNNSHKTFRGIHFQINPFSQKQSNIQNIKRTYDLYEIATMSSATSAKHLGLDDRGNLKPGSIADISIYDPSKPIDEMFENAFLVFKNGENIVNNGKILKFKKGRTQSLKLDYEKSICNDLQKWFDKYYSLDLDTFNVDQNFFEEENFNFH